MIFVSYIHVLTAANVFQKVVVDVVFVNLRIMVMIVEIVRNRF